MTAGSLSVLMSPVNTRLMCYFFRNKMMITGNRIQRAK